MDKEPGRNTEGSWTLEEVAQRGCGVPGHTGIQTQTGHGPEQPALVVPAPSSVGGHNDLQGSFQPQRACGVSQQKTLSAAMCVTCHPVGVPQAPESEQLGRCLRSLGPLSGGSVFAAVFFPGAGRHGWECPAFCTSAPWSELSAACGELSQDCLRI